MASRDPTLQAFLDSLQRALGDAASPETPAGRAVDRIFTRLKAPGEPGNVAPNQLPVTRHLDAALDAAGAASANVQAHAMALRVLAPRLAWYRRPGADSVGAAFADGHANALVVGVGGLEERGDVRIGVSLLAPDLVYPDHSHPPEEVYLVFSPGCWRQAEAPWHAPGLGGVVHNPPGILHAMRAGRAPLLATWCLWMVA